MDHETVRHALRSELQSRGYDVGGDTAGLRSELYVRGSGDTAAALFEFKTTADEACESMYQGRWLSHLPPRFAVLPVSQKHESGTDFLAQAGLSLLFYEEREGRVAFIDLPVAESSFKR